MYHQQSLRSVCAYEANLKTFSTEIVYIESLSKDTCLHMLVVFLTVTIPNHKPVRVNLRLEWDTD